jgi:hypothetical protein
MAREVYTEGALLRVTCTFSVAGVLTDPTTVTAVVRSPVGTTTTYLFGIDVELVKDSTGVYHVDIDANAGGRWIYRFAGTGTAQAADDEIFLVEDSEVI